MSYIYYKNKYLTLKKHLGGAVPNLDQTRFDNLDENMKTSIKEYLNCGEEFWVLLNTNNGFNNITFPINTTLNLVNPQQMCNNIQDPVQRQNCNIYYNQCYLKNLFRKYSLGQPEPVTYNVDTLNEIMLRTIPNNDQNKITEQNNLIAFGSTLIIIPNSYAESRGLIDITNITIPNSVQTIGDRAFINQALETIRIPNSVITIGRSAFEGNLAATTLNLGNSVQTIGSRAFATNSLQTLIIPNSVVTIGSGAFADNELETVTIGNSVQSIGMAAFMNNDIENLTIGNGVQRIGNQAFSGNNLENVIIGNSVQNIGNGAFANNELQTVTIPERFGPDIFRIFGRTNIPNIIYT